MCNLIFFFNAVQITEDKLDEDLKEEDFEVEDVPKEEEIAAVEGKFFDC